MRTLGCWLGATCLLSAHTTQAAALPELWNLLAGSFMDSCPAIDPQGNIYFTISGNIRFSDVAGGKLVALTPQGVQKWVFTSRLEVKSSPALGADGTIYFGSRDRRLYAITPDGKAKWSFPTGGWVDSSPAIATNGVVYFGSWDRKFYALNPDGSRKWEFATDGPVDSSPAIGADGTVYFGSHDKNFYALKPEGGKKWSFATEGAIISSPALGADGTIYFSSVDGRLYALNPDGSRKWHCWTGGTRESSPIIDAKGNIYLGVNDRFVAVTPEGTQKLLFGYPLIVGAAAAAADGTIHFAGTDQGVGIVYSWNPEGAGDIKAATPVGGPITGSLAVAPDGTIYVGSASTKFHALKGSAGLAASPWPKFRGNPAQTGRANAN